MIIIKLFLLYLEILLFRKCSLHTEVYHFYILSLPKAENLERRSAFFWLNYLIIQENTFDENFDIFFNFLCLCSDRL